MVSKERLFLNKSTIALSLASTPPVGVIVDAPATAATEIPDGSRMASVIAVDQLVLFRLRQVSTACVGGEVYLKVRQQQRGRGHDGDDPHCQSYNNQGGRSNFSCSIHGARLTTPMV